APSATGARTSLAPSDRPSAKAATGGGGAREDLDPVVARVGHQDVSLAVNGDAHGIAQSTGACSLPTPGSQESPVSRELQDPSARGVRDEHVAGRVDCDAGRLIKAPATRAPTVPGGNQGAATGQLHD